MSRLLILALTLLPASVGLAQDEGQAQEPQSPAAAKPRPELSYRLINQAFQGALTPEQLKALGPRATAEQMRDAMTPEQRSAARAGLAAAEANARTPEELKEIARGYLILDENAPNQGESALRVAQTLQTINPQDSDGFSMAGSASYQMGDYPAATEWAKQALKINPSDERARAVYMLSKDRIRRGASSAPGVTGTAAGPDGITAAGAEFSIPERHDITPQAIGFVRQAVAARRLGRMEETWNNVQAAMNADPQSKTVQKLYEMAKEDQARHADTKEFLRLSGEALDSGRYQEAVALAHRAYERSGHNPTVKQILDLTQQTADKRAQEVAKNDLEVSATKKSPRKGFHPLTTAAMIAGVLVLAWAATPQETKDHFKRVLWDEPRRELQLAAVAGLVAFAGWQFGPSALAAAKEMLAAVGPPAASAMQLAPAGAGGAGSGALAPALTWAEAATAAVKAGTLTLLARAGFKKAAEQYTNASDGSRGDPSKGAKQGDVYRNVEFYDESKSPLGEFDGVDLRRGSFIEDKSARGLGTVDPKTGLPNRTAAEWARDKIFDKTVTRIENLRKAVGTRPTRGGSEVVPELEKIKNIRRLEFRIDADSPALREAVLREVQQLSAKFPDWKFSATFGL